MADIHSFYYEMEENPITKKPSYTERRIYPVKIVCVVDEYSDTDNVIIEKIREHALKSGAVYQTRLFDSLRISDDRNNVRSLPAFHVYNRKAYIETFYPNTRPIQHINEAIERHKINEQRRANCFRPSHIIGWLKNLVRRVHTQRHPREWS